MDRRSFLKDSFVTGSTAIPFLSNFLDSKHKDKCSNIPSSNGEVLYNGIQLPSKWPPRGMGPDCYDPMPLPYLQSPPEVIPIDVGRQLFIDDFLIEYTNLTREFHQPKKHKKNPIITPKTESEKNGGICPAAAPFSDGCFYDPKDGLFKLYYMSGWFGGVALAISNDGIHWRRPNLDVIPNTNLVLAPDKLRRDGVSVWLDHDARNSDNRFKMYYWARKGEIGGELRNGTGFLLTSPDGVHWKWRGEIVETGDNTTFFYNPFRDVWVFTVRRFGRKVPPWATKRSPWGGDRGRARSYWENEEFLAAIGGWDEYKPVFWLGADNQDHKRDDYEIGRVPQLYKVDAVGYESLLLGMIQLHYGPPNAECAKGGFPKLTELQLAFSRDGFHWDRSNRETFIGATLEEDSWERAYIHSVGGVCNIVDDKIYFYYTGFQGNESNQSSNHFWNGMYANSSTGLATLRRDGFASMNAVGEEKILLTRPVEFKGRYLFVNVDSLRGSVKVELCRIDGSKIRGFGYKDCSPIKSDSTKRLVSWGGRSDIGLVGEDPVRLKFYLTNAQIYSFWISQNRDGASRGATAAGGPGLTGYWDT